MSRWAFPSENSVSDAVSWRSLSRGSRGQIVPFCGFDEDLIPRHNARLFCEDASRSTNYHEVMHMADSSQREPSILRRKQVQARTGLARSTIYLNIKQGTFPKPIPLGSRAVGWIESEISDWIAERIRIARGKPGR